MRQTSTRFEIYTIIYGLISIKPNKFHIKKYYDIHYKTSLFKHSLNYSSEVHFYFKHEILFLGKNIKNPVILCNMNIQKTIYFALWIFGIRLPIISSRNNTIDSYHGSTHTFGSPKFIFKNSQKFHTFFRSILLFYKNLFIVGQLWVKFNISACSRGTGYNYFFAFIQ